ncbi:TetR/AcrR family transcriptional regulator [Nocardia veterana]|uniref:TetR/AcrR family transcriptional regulator n=2 Tax=Nocardia veterana TaxID=132249 RepID=A0A7X6M4S0_9NOCA|nr:TetR/AcrR family transcriptional regulator [Nocardia veterana]
MTSAGPGRPRVDQRSRRGGTPRAEILDAAAELFTANGYGSTSTRGIADAVGIRQASLYHHFAAKDDILDALLAETITAPLELAQRLRAEPDPAAVRLYALAWADVRQLCAAKWNLGALYLLPELRSDRFAEFRDRRARLRRHYEELAAAAVEAAGPHGVPGAEVLPFRVVETVINIRSDEGSSPAYADTAIPEAALRLLGVTADPGELRGAAERLLRRLDALR